jgi:PTS system nitrogen regulatory IIA component
VLNKTQLLEDLCRRAASILKVDADKISADILKREELGSTGMGGGVAIPHARMADVKRPFGLLVRLKSAIEFDAIDRQPVDLVFLLLLPTASAGEQLNALALVARRLRDADTVCNARRATAPSGLYAAMAQSST